MGLILLKYSIPHVILNYKRTKFEKIATKLLLEKKSIYYAWQVL